jgi:hypothetical protein
MADNMSRRHAPVIAGHFGLTPELAAIGLFRRRPCAHTNGFTSLSSASMDTFGDVTSGQNGKPLPQAQVIAT